MKRTQIGWVIIVAAVCIELLSIYQHITGTSFYVLSSFMVAMVLLFGTLTIRVNKESIQFSMGIGLIRGRYKFSDIEYVRPNNYIPMGFGIRLRPGVTLFNVSGYKAIEIQRKNKYRKIWIGCSNPEEIVAYINSLSTGKQTIYDS